MKNINTYINERLHVTTKSHAYSCQPKTKDELRSIIIERIDDDGPECDLNDIDVSKITDMSHLFDGEYNVIFTNFNGDVSQWNVSNVERMDFMFNDCKNFNCDISDWDVSNVVNMRWMFSNCIKFNGDISRWDVSNVTNMAGMFWGCERFNGDLSKWDVSNVKYMQYMLKRCISFRQNLDEWNVSNVEDMTDAFYKCPTQPEWYDKDKWEKHYGI